ncbi:MAG: (Fe-S)-binding protein [Deinococcales bacterium]
MSTAPITLENFVGSTAASPLIAGSDICVQCGVCLSACPTYQLTGEEIQSPRGRVMLYRAAAEGLTKDYEVVLEAAYDCLDCRACQTVCPSGVKPGEMAVETRVALQGGKPPNLKIRAILEPFKYPVVWDMLNFGVRTYQGLGLQKWVRSSKILEKFGAVGKKLAELENILPEKVAPSIRTRLAPVTPAVGEKRGRVAFFLGCLMNAFFSEASSATVQLLTLNGFEVVTPRETTCCGAPHIEEGDREGFDQVVKRNLDLFDALDVDAIITDCAGCGAELKKYVKMFANDPEYAQKARDFSGKSFGISEFLRRHGLRDLPQANAPEMRVTYQDACHLCHGQGCSSQPRDLLKQNPLVQYTELEKASDCCGSAGIYNITHPETSYQILEGKMQRVRESKAEVLSVENPGCLLQLEAGTRRFDVDVKVLHTSQVLLAAYKK